MNRDYETYQLNWDGIDIEIRWARHWLDFDDETSMGHLEICSIGPEKHPLPMTETGYRSHFIHAQELDQHGGPENYVEAWLANESKSEAWIDCKAGFQQLALF